MLRPACSGPRTQQARNRRPGARISAEREPTFVSVSNAKLLGRFQVLSQSPAAFVGKACDLLGSVARIGPSMVLPPLGDIGQRDLGEHAIAEIDAVVTVLGGGKDQLGLRDVARIEIQGPWLRMIRLGGIRRLPAVGQMLPIGESGGILKTLRSDQCFGQFASHRWRVVAARLERNLVGDKLDAAPLLTDLLQGPLRSPLVTRDHGAETDHRFNKPNRRQVGFLLSVGQAKIVRLGS